MLKFFHRPLAKQKGNFFLALDIGTDFVKALVCEAMGPKAHVLGVGRRRQELGTMQSGTITDIARVIRNCEHAIRDAEKMAGAVPTQFILGVAGELVKGDTTAINYTRKDPDTKIDLSELKNIVHKVQWKSFDQVRSQLARETGFNEIDIKLVNAAVTDVRIDGYRVANPIGFQGKEVSVSIFNAFSPLVHYGALQTIGAELDLELIGITVEPYAISRCMGFEDGGNFNAIFIDVGGGTTDIAVVRYGGCDGTKMFTLGGRTFTKRLTHRLNISFEEAEEIKLAYSADKLEKQSHGIVREALAGDTEVWLSGVALTLGEFYNVDTLPSKILLCGGGSHLPEIKEALSGSQWYRSLSFARKPQVNFLQPRHVVNLIDETGKLKDSQDIASMALANLALEQLSEEQIMGKLLKKVVRLMQV